MKKSNLIIFALIMIILILAIILGVKMANPSSDEFERLSAEEIREKMLLGLTYNNYTITCEFNGSKLIKKIKDDIVISYDSSSGLYSWNNRRRRISIAGNTKTDEYSEVRVVNDYLFNKHFIYIEENLKDYGDNLYHMKNERYNGKDCIVVLAGKNRSETYWVDAEMGFVLKYEALDGSKEEYEFELDNVTDEDVKAPLSKYR